MKNRLKALLTLVIMAICCLPASTAATARTASAKTTSAKAPSAQTAARPTSLRIARDSLLHLLSAHPAANQTRIDILTNLSDVSMALSNDRSSLVRLWDEGIRQQNPDGLNVSEYINRKRVRHARYLFECEPETSIDEVADRCGFASRSRFHTAFKEQYNMTPGEFRKAIKSK